MLIHTLAQSIRQALRSGRNLGALLTVPALLAGLPLDVQAQDANKDSPKLETIEVTGSNIRRVDIETANPVVTIDKAAIQRSGKQTLGDLIQDLPAIAGPQQNGRVNNGGGSGAATVSLRGLGAARTLVLVDGHRINNADVNSIPANVVERIEVLTDGASATYGSDAIGGVVNFILRKNYQGANFSTDYGISDHDDGERKGYHFSFGQTSDKGSIMAGVDYNKSEPVPAANRQFSDHAVYYQNGAPFVAGGSSANPNGFIVLPANLKAQFGCASVTRKQGAVGTSLGDYRCYTAADGFNFQAVGNVLLVKQERTSAFVIGNYKLTDNVETYLEVYHNKTVANSALAPYPADTRSAPFTISGDSYYNPFGVDLTGTATRFRARLTSLGNRETHNATTSDQAIAGFRGTFGDSSWAWDANFDFGHTQALTLTSGFLNVGKLNAGAGPSYNAGTAANPKIVCGTDPAKGGSGPIAGCNPFNFLNIFDPNTIAALQGASANPFTNFLTSEKSVNVSSNGTVFNLPAGAVQLALGASYRKEYSNTQADAIEVSDAQGNCDIGSGCVSSLQGGYNVKEVYGEVLIPILKDAPFASALNLTLGDRYSKYSNFGSTNNWKAAIEYRPIEDLLLRGTVSKVFRAPTVSNIFAAFGSTAPQLIDPCDGLDATGLAAHSAVCKGIGAAQLSPDGKFHYPTGGNGQFAGVTSGSKLAGVELTPEFGKSFDFGVVYDPHWLPGLSVSTDLWRVYLNNNIAQISAANSVNLCYLGGTSVTSTCGFITRDPTTGQIASIAVPIGNIGRLDTSGVDLAATYRLPETAFGNFTANFQTTYLKNFSDDTAPGSGALVQQFAGHYSTGASAITYANFSRWKALANLSWRMGAFDASITSKYVGKYKVGYVNPAYNISADRYVPAVELKYGASVYNNVQVGYNIEPINTRIDLGIDNVGNKQPAQVYNNNSLNGNVDVNTFDTVGRFYWARLSVKF